MPTINVIAQDHQGLHALIVQGVDLNHHRITAPMKTHVTIMWMIKLFDLTKNVFVGNKKKLNFDKSKNVFVENKKKLKFDKSKNVFVEHKKKLKFDKRKNVFDMSKNANVKQIWLMLECNAKMKSAKSSMLKLITMMKKE